VITIIVLIIGLLYVNSWKIFNPKRTFLWISHLWKT